ncbi:MAG: ATP-binding protein [Candidatus Zambryskibacteria bacterium]|nr:ATP-binding protein [Candidatus Zambryskibacteria bacterium]
MGLDLNYFSVSALIGGFTALLSGFVVYIHNHKTTENVAWFLFNLSSAVWSLGYFVLITALDKNVAYISDWVLHIAAILVPLFCLLSVVYITDTYKKYKNSVTIASFLALLFIISTPTELFIRDVVPKANFNYLPEVGPLYLPFTIYFFGLVVYILTILCIKFKNSRDIVEKQRYRYMIIFFTAGSIGGGSVFFLNFNIPIIPYPIILFSLFPIISIYAIFRLQLFNVKVISTEFLVFSLWIFIFIRTLLSVSIYDRLLNGGLLIIILTTGVLLIRSVIREVRLRVELDESNKKLKEVNDGQTSLIHFMNHQIKGRFGITKNIFAELLTEDYGTMPPASISLLQKGLDEANIGVAYVMSILKGASAESGTLQYEKNPINIKSIVQEVFDAQKEFAEKKGLKIDLNIEEGDYSIIGDKLQLGEAVKNLIDNSINYTLEGSISVNLSQKDGIILLKVSDTGVGITAEDKPNLFKAGGKGVNSLKVNVNATGYGLAFVRSVLKAHGGHVWVESDGKGKGSDFFIELPKK